METGYEDDGDDDEISSRGPEATADPAVIVDTILGEAEVTDVDNESLAWMRNFVRRCLRVARKAGRREAYRRVGQALQDGRIR